MSRCDFRLETRPPDGRRYHGRGATPRSAVLWLLLVILAAACSGPGRDREIVLRWIADEPADHFHPQQLLTMRTVFTWHFQEPADLEPWQPRLRIHDGGLSVPGPAFPLLVRRTRLLAESVDRIEVDLGGLQQGEVRLLWSGPGEELNRQRCLVVKVGQPGRRAGGRYLFKVASHPRWQGPIRQLGIHVVTTQPQPLYLRAIRGFCGEIDGQRLATASARSWKVELGNEVRNALLAAPGQVLEQRVEVPPHGRLQLAYGSETASRRAVRFRVEAITTSGRHTLFEDEVSPEAGETDRWHGASIDLDEFAGETIRLVLTTARPQGAERWIPYWAEPMILGPASVRRPNVVLIVIDTLRADHLSLYGYQRPTTPEIDRWARRHAVSFRSVVAPAPWTLPSHISLFTGLDALGHGYNYNLPLPASAQTLAELLRRAGYTTLAITGGGYLHPSYGLAQGFDRFRYWPFAEGGKGELHSGIEQALRRLTETADRPFFLFFHTYEVHLPWRVRRPFFERFADDPEAMEALAAHLTAVEDPAAEDSGFVVRRRYALRSPHRGEPPELLEGPRLRRLRDLYDSGIAFADHHVGRLLAALDADNTVVVLTSDHGEALGEHGLGDHAYLYDFNLLVPLIIAVPGTDTQGQMVSQQVRLLDVPATILEAVGLDLPAGLDAVSLLPLIRNPHLRHPPPALNEAWSYAASSNAGVALRLANRWKLTYNNTAWPAVRGAEKLYRLDRGGEQLVGSDAVVAAKLRQRVLQRLTERFRGLRMQVANGGSRERTVALSAAFVRPRRVKSHDRRQAGVAWRPDGRLVVQVPAAAETILDFEGVTASNSLTLQADGRQPCQLDLGELDAGEVLVADADTCRRSPADGGDPVTLSLTLALIGGYQTVAPAVVDAELEAQLRALGYAN